MSLTKQNLLPRAERFFVSPNDIVVHDDHIGRIGSVQNISRSGFACVTNIKSRYLSRDNTLGSILLEGQGRTISCGPASIVRKTSTLDVQGSTRHSVGFSFERDQADLIESFSSILIPYPFMTGVLRRGASDNLRSNINAFEHTIEDFYSDDSPDLFEKCNTFNRYGYDLEKKGLYQRLYRITLTSKLDSRVTVFDPIQRRERVFTCFDSNSYLGLHLHPRVIQKVEEVLKKVGIGTPSAQILCGTNRYLRELELALSDFHGREDTIIFPSGFAANIGVIGALIRPNDAVIRDQFAHASIHEGCRSSHAKFSKIFAHNNPESAQYLLKKASDRGYKGKLIVTDGVFSMHGGLARLPELVAVAQRNGAKLMVDDAHGTGVLGRTGRGIEEHFGMEGKIDIIMGTLSKTLGSLGGYISGSRAIIRYLRFFAASGLFTTTIPAAWSAGVTESLKIIQEEPEHRLYLWDNINQFSPALRQAGFIVPDPVSPITTVFVGTLPLMWKISGDLFDAGIKCGNVAYPAVPRNNSILRFTINARHNSTDLERTIDVLVQLGRKYGILNKTKKEIVEIGALSRDGV